MRVPAIDYRVNTHHSLTGSAALSSDGAYRFRLVRDLGPEPKTCVFVMLNPSTADHEQDDPTILRCMGYAKAWGCGQLDVVNLFAYRATSPDELFDAAKDDRLINIEGRHNQHFVRHSAIAAKMTGGPVICAWGTNGRFRDADIRMVNQLLWKKELTALRLTKDGDPSHPLYLPKALTPIPFTVRQASRRVAA